MDNLDLIIAGMVNEFNNLKSISSNMLILNYLGWINCKDKFFKSIDAFCSTSLIEPFGLVIIEAMARGIPVISTNCNGPKDIIKNNQDGLLVEKNNKVRIKKCYY